jgi:hypothetical protein
MMDGTPIAWCSSEEVGKIEIWLSGGKSDQC